MPALLIRTDIPPEELRRLACREDDARVVVLTGPDPEGDVISARVNAPFGAH